MTLHDHCADTKLNLCADTRTVMTSMTATIKIKPTAVNTKIYQLFLTFTANAVVDPLQQMLALCSLQSRQVFESSDKLQMSV